MWLFPKLRTTKFEVSFKTVTRVSSEVLSHLIWALGLEALEWRTWSLESGLLAQSVSGSAAAGGPGVVHTVPAMLAMIRKTPGGPRWCPYALAWTFNDVVVRNHCQEKRRLLQARGLRASAQSQPTTLAPLSVGPAGAQRLAATHRRRSCRSTHESVVDSPCVTPEQRAGTKGGRIPRRDACASGWAGFRVRMAARAAQRVHATRISVPSASC
jgi:hypothetical protein